MEPLWFETIVKFVMLAGMLVGLFGLIVPSFPGITVIWGLVLIYGVVFGFGTLGLWMSIIITILAIVGWVSDNLLVSGKALQGGARWTSLALALTAGFVGSFLLTPIGGILLTLLTLFLAETFYRKDRHEAWEVTKSMAIGWGWAFLVRFGVGLVMIALWAIWAWV